MTDLCPQFRAFALAQGPLFPEVWPLPAQSFNTGGDAAYGWNHRDGLTMQTYLHWLQCYAAREVYFDNEPYRLSGYDAGGSPPGHVPANPPAYYLDLEHFPLGPMLALYDHGSPFWVKTAAGNVIHAPVAAANMLRYLGAAHAGMLRKPDGKTVSGWACSLRSAHYVLRTLTELGKRGLMAAADIVTLKTYIDITLLSWWERPTWLEGGGGKGAEGGDTRQWFNGGAWLLPALWDYVRELPPGKLKRRHGEIIRGLSLQAAQLQAISPGTALQTERVDRWAGLAPAGITQASFYGPWSVRAWLVAGVVLGSPVMRLAALQEAARWPLGQEAWLVDEDGKALSP